MKTIRIILLILIIIGIGLLLTQKIWVPKLVNQILIYQAEKSLSKEENNKPNKSKQSLVDGKYCFNYSKDATSTEPYKVKENIILEINGNKVSGTKSGTQNGPDMNNGYTGNLDGTRNVNSLELVYSYIIEGSKNKELEVYEFTNGKLLKNRWPLVEKDGMLIPNKTGEPKIIPYTRINCSI